MLPLDEGGQRFRPDRRDDDPGRDSNRDGDLSGVLWQLDWWLLLRFGRRNRPLDCRQQEQPRGRVDRGRAPFPADQRLKHLRHHEVPVHFLAGQLRLGDAQLIHYAMLEICFLQCPQKVP